MGLDQTAWAQGQKDQVEDLQDWRKHADLQGWMENLYRQKGGEGKFNGVSVELEQEDLVRLYADTVNCRLPKTTGFFFGTSREEHREETLAFIMKAEQFLSQGWRIFYASSW